jgi:hypothetical protein
MLLLRGCHVSLLALKHHHPPISYLPIPLSSSSMAPKAHKRKASPKKTTSVKRMRRERAGSIEEGMEDVEGEVSMGVTLLTKAVRKKLFNVV